MTDREKLMSLIWHKQDCGLTGQDFVTYNAELADHLIAHGVTVRERGRWKKTYTCHGEQLWGYECNQCKADNPRASYFCPNCGADMRGEEDA